MKLSIKEIADLKEGRKSLEEITKTHDGTSMGKVKDTLEDFIKNHRLNKQQAVKVYEPHKPLPSGYIKINPDVPHGTIEEELEYIKKNMRDIPSLEKGLEEGKFYARLYIPYTLTWWLVVGKENVKGDINLLAIERRRGPILNRNKMQLFSLKNLLEFAPNLRIDDKWNMEKGKEIYNSKDYEEMKTDFLNLK